MSDSHRCLARGLCRASVVEDGKKMPAITEAPDTLCPSCTRSVRCAVEDLPRDYVGLHSALGERGTAAGQRVRSTPTPPIPLNVSVEAAMRDISETLDRAAELVSDALHCDPPTGSEARRVDLCSRMVAPHIDKLVAADPEDVWRWDKSGEKQHLAERSGVQFALDLQQLHRTSRRLIGETQPKLRLAIPCPQCSAPFLFEDKSKVLCVDCGYDHTEDTFQLLGDIAKQQQREDAEMAELDDLRKRAELAEAETQELRRRLQLALDPEFEGIPAGVFAKEVLKLADAS